MWFKRLEDWVVCVLLAISLSVIACVANAADCVEFVGTPPVLQLVAPQPSDFSSCTYVLISGAEVSNSPFALTIEQGHEIGMAIMLVCAIAWGFRAIVKAVNVDTNQEV